MAGISHWFGQDIEFDVAGDIMTTDDTSLQDNDPTNNADNDIYTKQLIINCLLARKGSDVFNPGYGAGLMDNIGKNLTKELIQEMQTTVLAQIFTIQGVSQSPRPIIAFDTFQEGSVSGFVLKLTYTDAAGQTQFLSFPVKR